MVTHWGHIFKGTFHGDGLLAEMERIAGRQAMSDTYTEFGPIRYDQQEVAARGYGMASQRSRR